LVQVSSLAPCSQTPSLYVPPLMSEIKFCIKDKIIALYILIVTSLKKTRGSGLTGSKHYQHSVASYIPH
jgi:hypothetical protein